MAGNQNSGRLPQPREKAAALIKADGVTPGHRRLSPKGTQIVSPSHASIPDPPEYGEDGKPLQSAAAELYQEIWQTGYWLWPDADRYWITEIALLQHEIIENNKIVNTQGVMIRGDRSLIEHPLRVANRQLKAKIASYMQRAGFDPVSRAKLQIAEVQVASGLAALQKKTASRNGAS